MNRKCSLTVVATLVIPAWIALGQNPVQVRSVAAVLIAKDTPALLVAYRYNFDDRQTVYVRGLGVVPARGEFQYLSRDAELEFRDGPGGRILANIPLKETVIVAAKPPLNEIPREDQFPSALRAYAWQSPRPFLEGVNVVIARHFHYLPRNDDKLTYVVTTFAPLRVSGLPRGSVARIALMFSFPHTTAAGNPTIYVRSLVREGRALSDEVRPTNNASIVAAADAFVEQLMAELTKG